MMDIVSAFVCGGLVGAGIGVMLYVLLTWNQGGKE